MPRWQCYGFPANPLTALTHDMRDELSAGLAEAAASRQARAVILTEAGRAFCAGVDIAGSVGRGQC